MNESASLLNRLFRGAAFAAAIAVGVGSSSVDGVASDSVSLRYASFNNEMTVLGRTANWYMDEVEIRSGGRIKFDRFFSGALLPPNETLAGIVDGRTDIGHVAAPYNPAELPLSQAAGVPFLVASGPAALRALNRLYAESELFRQEYEKQGVHVISFGLLPRASLGTTVPVESLTALKGKKLRALGYSAIAVGAIAEPIVIPPSELYQALQRRAIDGFLQPFDIAVLDSGLAEVTPYFADPGVGSFAAVALLTINKERWDALPEDLRKIMDEVALEVPGKSEEILREVEVAACAKLREHKGTINRLPAEEIAAWKDDTQEKAFAAWMADAAKFSSLSESDLTRFRDQYVAIVAEELKKAGYQEVVSNGCDAK